MFKHNCATHGHRYEARYEDKEGASFNIEISNANNATLQEIRDLMFYKIYLYDICTRCGGVVKRGSDNGL
jgi:hypothetical protein